MMKHLLFVSALLFVTPAWSQAIVVATCGTGAFTVGQLHQLTMDPAGYLCVSTTTLTATGAQGTPPGVHPPNMPPAPPGPSPALPEPKK